MLQNTAVSVSTHACSCCDCSLCDRNYCVKRESVVNICMYVHIFVCNRLATNSLMMKRVMGKQISYMTLIGMHSTLHVSTVMHLYIYE